MNYTKEELTKWLRAELVELVHDIATVKKSDMPEFNQGLDIVCAFDAKVARILEKLAALDLYEALKLYQKHQEGTRDHYCWRCAEAINQAVSKAEGK